MQRCAAMWSAVEGSMEAAVDGAGPLWSAVERSEGPQQRGRSAAAAAQKKKEGGTAAACSGATGWQWVLVARCPHL